MYFKDTIAKPIDKYALIENDLSFLNEYLLLEDSGNIMQRFIEFIKKSINYVSSKLKEMAANKVFTATSNLIDKYGDKNINSSYVDGNIKEFVFPKTNIDDTLINNLAKFISSVTVKSTGKYSSKMEYEGSFDEINKTMEEGLSVFTKEKLLNIRNPFNIEQIKNCHKNNEAVLTKIKDRFGYIQKQLNDLYNSIKKINDSKHISQAIKAVSGILKINGTIYGCLLSSEMSLYNGFKTAIK